MRAWVWVMGFRELEDARCWREKMQALVWFPGCQRHRVSHRSERFARPIDRTDGLIWKAAVIREDIQPASVPDPSLEPEPAELIPANVAPESAVEKTAELTPFMKQWSAAKRENPDALLFFRMGDFYELFYNDAVVASRELQLTLTARDRERQVPMCGVPYHSVENYLMRLLRKGFRIAICDQMEDPKLTKKLVRREVTRVLSPGTALDTALGQEQNNFLAAFLDTPGRTGVRCGPCARWHFWMSPRGSSAHQNLQALQRVIKRSKICCLLGRARCCWRPVQISLQHLKELQPGRESMTGSGLATSRCRWSNAN